MAGLTKVPVQLRKFDEQQKLEMALIENIQRADLNPIEEATAYYNLIQMGDLNQEEVAKRVGKARATVANAIRLLKLPEDIQHALTNGQITSGHARALLMVKNDADMRVMFAKILYNDPQFLEGRQPKIEQLRKERNLDEFAPLLLTNNDIGKEFGIKKEAVHEISRHNFFTKGHIQAVQEIDKLIENSIYIGKEGNEDNRDPSLKEFYYCLRGVKIGNEDYTAKCVFVLNNKNELYYDQNLSEIEKGRIVDTILKNNMLETSSPLQKGADSFEQIRQESPDKFYDKRLNRICQVPQMPYLEKNIITGKWQPTKEAIKAVKEYNDPQFLEGRQPAAWS